MYILEEKRKKREERTIILSFMYQERTLLRGVY